MSILAPIQRNMTGTPNIVTFPCDNTLAELTAPGFLVRPDIASQIFNFNNGPFDWLDSDIVCIYYKVGLINGLGWFAYDGANNTFTEIVADDDTVDFQPSATFSTPGNLSVSYTQRTGVHQQSGNINFVSIALTFVPTYTTASGNFLITGLPTNAIVPLGGTILQTGSFSYPGVGYSWLTPSTLLLQPSAEILAHGPSVPSTPLTTTQITSGSSQVWRLALIYTN